MPRLQIRWSEHEASKPYARPFGVSFLDDDGGAVGGVAVSGADLLYYRQFKAAVLALGGELFGETGVDAADDQQRAWLDVVGSIIPTVLDLHVVPASTFDPDRGRIFRFDVTRDGARVAAVDAATLLDYQEFQAAVAHQSGLLFRAQDVEAERDPRGREAAWERTLRTVVARPHPNDAMAEHWPWR